MLGKCSAILSPLSLSCEPGSHVLHEDTIVVYLSSPQPLLLFLFCLVLRQRIRLFGAGMLSTSFVGKYFMLSTSFVGNTLSQALRMPEKHTP